MGNRDEKMVFQQLTPRNKFMVTLIRGEQEELLIINTFSGEVLKVKDPEKHSFTIHLCNEVKSSGVCSDDGEICRSLMAENEVYHLVNLSEYRELSKMHDRINRFLISS